MSIVTDVDLLVEQLMMVEPEPDLPPHYRDLLPGNFYEMDEELDLPSILEETHHREKEPIILSRHTRVEDRYFSMPEAEQTQDIFDRGVFLGEKSISHERDDFDSKSCGFKVWALPEQRIAVQLYYYSSHREGSLSAIGYTGSEETTSDFKTPLIRTLLVGGNAAALEDETRADLVEVRDIRRVGYSREAERHILDWDNEQQRWTNSWKGSYDTKWQDCPMNQRAEQELRKVMKPIAEELGISYSGGVSTNVQDLVEEAVGYGPGLLGSYRQGLYREPYPGERQRDQRPGIDVDVYLDTDRRFILLKEESL